MDHGMKRNVSWFGVQENELEEQVLSDYSEEAVRKHLEYLSTFPRRAGTEGELKAAKYIKSRLDEFGVEAEIHEFDAFLSLPGEAALEVLSPIKKSFACLPGVFIAPTAAEGLEAELVYLEEKGEGYDEKKDIQNKIVLIAGTKESRGKAIRLAEEKKAIAQVHVTPGKTKAISVRQPRSAWGSPTPETIDKILKPPVISVCHEDGNHLKQLTQKGPVVVRLKANAWHGYKKVRLPVGHIRGMSDPDQFVLVGGHYCSWFTSATDNAVSNSLMLEMARIFSKYRKRLHRGVRFCWWTGHEQGTFAGSTWYADHFWDDLRDHAIAYLAMDGLGRKGSSGFEAKNTKEIRGFQEQVIKEVLGLKIKSGNIPRSGDQSFMGIGLPSFIGKPGFHRTAKGDHDPVWYSHTAEDTLDKVDPRLIEIPFKAHTVTILRLCNHPVLPLEFVSQVKELKEELKSLKLRHPSLLGLGSVINQTDEVEKKIIVLNSIISKSLSVLDRRRPRRELNEKMRKINTCLMELSRIFIPAFTTKTGKYGQDPVGTRFNSIPALQPIEKLNELENGSEAYQALLTSLLRERNKLSDALNSADRLLENTVGAV